MIGIDGRSCRWLWLGLVLAGAGCGGENRGVEEEPPAGGVEPPQAQETAEQDTVPFVAFGMDTTALAVAPSRQAQCPNVTSGRDTVVTIGRAGGVVALRGSPKHALWIFPNELTQNTTFTMTELTGTIAGVDIQPSVELPAGFTAVLVIDHRRCDVDPADPLAIFEVTLSDGTPSFGRMRPGISDRGGELAYGLMRGLSSYAIAIP